MKRMLFLGYGREQTGLIREIEARGWAVAHETDPVHDLSTFDLAISYGYRHILKASTLETAKRPVLNLHIAYLPFNRGAHPLFWAAYDGTPTGVTIHEIDPGIDTGPVCFQETVGINAETETFASGYKLLISAMEALFLKSIDSLLAGSYKAAPQPSTGTMRRVRDLPTGFTWSEVIAPTIRRLKHV